MKQALILTVLALSSCKTQQTVNQTMHIHGGNGGNIQASQQAQVTSGKRTTATATQSAVSQSNIPAGAGATATIQASSSAIVAGRQASASVSVQSPLGRWSGRDGADPITIDFGAGSLKLTNPDGSVSGTWKQAADGSVQIQLRTQGPYLLQFTGANSAIFHKGGNAIPLSR